MERFATHPCHFQVKCPLPRELVSLDILQCPVFIVFTESKRYSLKDCSPAGRGTFRYILPGEPEKVPTFENHSTLCTAKI